MIDCISGGRLIAGFPVGTPMDTRYAYGTNPSQLRERYHEAHDLMLRAWTEKETFAFNGRFNQQRYVNIWPRPIQQPHPPIWIPGGGSVETWHWARRDGLRLLLPLLLRLQDGPGVMNGFWEEMERLGKDRNPYRAGFLQFVGVAESRQQALELYREPAEYFYGRCLHVDAALRGAARLRDRGDPARRHREPGQDGGGGQGRRRTSTNAASATKMQSLARDMKGIVDNGYVIIGTPDEVAEQLREVATTLNVGQLMLLLQFGNMSSRDHQVQHAAVRREGDAAAQAAVRRVGEPLVAEAAGPPAARDAARLPACDARSLPSERAHSGAGSVNGPDTSTIDINGFATRVWRKGAGPKIGFLAGYGGLPRWVPFLDRLAETRTVIVPSLPGFPGGDRGHSRARQPARLGAGRAPAHRQGGPRRRRSRRQLGRRLARRRGGGDLAGQGQAAGADRARSACSTRRTPQPTRGRRRPTRFRA